MRLASTTRRAIRSLVVLALIGEVIGCGGPSPSVDGSPTSSPAGSAAVVGELELRYTCGTFGFDPAFLNQEGNAEQGADPIAEALRVHLAMPGPDFDILPDTGWLLVGVDDRAAELIARDRLGSLMSISVTNGETGWRVTGWGNCGPALILPPGLNGARWLPDPEGQVPDAATRAFTALVTENECASGQPSVGRVVGPVISVDAERVLVAFAVRALPAGAQTCQGNPSTPVLIDLGRALGDRVLIDAGHLPFEDVREADPAS